MKTKTAVDEALARLTRAIDRPWDNGSLPSYEDKSTPVTRFINRWTKPTPDSISGTLPTLRPRDPLYPTHDPDLPTPHPRTPSQPSPTSRETARTTGKTAPASTPSTAEPHLTASASVPAAAGSHLTPSASAPAAAGSHLTPSASVPVAAGSHLTASASAPVAAGSHLHAPASAPATAGPHSAAPASIPATAGFHSAAPASIPATAGPHLTAPVTDRFPAISLPTARRGEAPPSPRTQSGHAHSTPSTDPLAAISSLPAPDHHSHQDDPPVTPDDLVDDPNPPRRRMRIPRIAAVVAVLTGALLAGFLTLPSTPTTAAEPPQPLDLPTVATSRTLTIDVQGKVRNPGVHHLPEGSRIVDAIKAGGGLKPGTDTSDLNLARPLVDGEQIRVDIAPAPPPPADPATPPRANLNTAPVYQLDALPGVGIVTAQRIVEFRTRHGRFTDVAQLRQIEGIGPARFAKLKDLVTVD